MHSQREHKQKMLRLNRPFRAAKMFTDEEEKKRRLHQKNAYSQQQNAQRQTNRQANRQANEARQVANEESALDERLAQVQCDKSVQDSSTQLENIKAEGFRLATGAHTGTQLDQPRSVNTQPRAAQRQRQGQSQRPCTATSPAIPLYFVGESEDKPPPPQRQYSQTSVVDQGRQSRQASMPAAYRPISTSTSRPATY